MNILKRKYWEAYEPKERKMWLNHARSPLSLGTIIWFGNCQIKNGLCDTFHISFSWSPLLSPLLWFHMIWCVLLTLCYTFLNLQGHKDCRDDSGRFSGVFSSSGSPRFGVSRSSSRLSIQEDLDDIDFTCPFAVDDVDTTDSQSRYFSYLWNLIAAYTAI